MLNWNMVIYLFLPETQRHSLEDMDTIFRTSKNAFDVVKVSRELVKCRLRAEVAHAEVTTSIKHGSDDEKAKVQTLENV